MFDSIQILERLAPLVSWYEDYRAEDAWQMKSNFDKVANRWQAAHPMLTLDNLQELAPRYDQQYPGDKEAIEQAFTAWVVQQTADGVNQVLNDWKAQHVPKFGNRADAAGFRQLYNEGRVQLLAPTTSAGKLYGLWLKGAKSKSLVVQLKTVALALSAAGLVTVRLWRRGTPFSAAQSMPVNVMAGYNPQHQSTSAWVLLPDTDYLLVWEGGASLRGVDQEDAQRMRWGQGNASVAVGAVRLDLPVANGYWSPDTVQRVDGTAFGLNVVTQTQCSLTQFVADNLERFVPVLLLGVGCHFLRLMLSNPNSKVNRSTGGMDYARVAAELDGDMERKANSSLSVRYTKALKAMVMDTSTIGEACLPRKKRPGARFRPVAEPFLGDDIEAKRWSNEH